MAGADLPTRFADTPSAAGPGPRAGTTVVDGGPDVSCCTDSTGEDSHGSQ